MLFLTNLTYCNKYRPFDLHLVILYLVLRNLFKKKKKRILIRIQDLTHMKHFDKKNSLNK